MEDQKRVEVSVFQKPKKGNYYCGDSYFYLETNHTFICALADGLGSGEFAKESSQLVVETIKKYYKEPIKQILRRCNEQLLGKRGVVLGILQMDFESDEYYYTSIGKISLITVTEDSIKTRNIPQAGYLTGYERPYKIVRNKLKSGMTFVLFSDGVTSEDISSMPIVGEDMESITNSFAELYTGDLEDDTTIIAMKVT
ncbi:phosphoserine phosphatase RsbX [Gracilibacillus halotolerans]|uniref:SpoIIE family protein phosphatase n=1 Tax=Gracilibacillus halotolerans TaxID=74386 RepID=UPI0031CE5B1C